MIAFHGFILRHNAATEEMFDGMMERLVERLKQALSIWRSYLSQYKANHCKSSLTITIVA